jgi:hypothetical protein
VVLEFEGVVKVRSGLRAGVTVEVEEEEVVVVLV